MAKLIMIEIDPATGFMIYLGAMLLLVLGTWCYTHLTTRKRKVGIEERKLHICEYCHFVYLDLPDKERTQCPQCHSYNKD